MVFCAGNLSNPCIMNLQSLSLWGQNCLILIRSWSSAFGESIPTHDTLQNLRLHWRRYQKIGCSVSISFTWMEKDGQGNTNMQKHNPEDIANASLQVTIASLWTTCPPEVQPLVLWWRHVLQPWWNQKVLGIDRFSELLSIQVTERPKRLRFYNQINCW